MHVYNSKRIYAEYLCALIRDTEREVPMKKKLLGILSLFLTLALMSMSAAPVSEAVWAEKSRAEASNALPDSDASTTLNLPSSLKTVSARAFYGNTSLTDVVIPYGATSIGEKAFANSSVKRILIPASVNNIAADAFEGTGSDFVIYSPIYTAAYDYALEHGYEWKDSKRENLNDLLELLDGLGEGEDAAITLDEMTDELISTDGVTDPELLQLIEDYNRVTLEAAAATQEFIGYRNQLRDVVNSYNEIMNDCSLNTDGGGLNLNAGSLGYTIPSDLYDALGDNVELVSYDTDDDGSLILKLDSDGQIIYVKATQSGLTRLYDYVEEPEDPENPQGPSQPSENRAAAGNSVMPQSNAPQDDILQQLENVNERVGYLCDVLDGWGDSVENAAVDLYRARAEQSNASERLMHYGRITRAQQARIAEQATTARNNVSAVRRFRGILAPLNLGSASADLAADIYKIRRLTQISLHGHPTDSETDNPEKVALSQLLRREYDRAYPGLLAKAVFDTAQILSSLRIIAAGIAALGGPAGWGIGAIVVGLITTVELIIRNVVLDVVFDVMADSHYEQVIVLDEQIHDLPDIPDPTTQSTTLTINEPASVTVKGKVTLVECTLTIPENGTLELKVYAQDSTSGTMELDDYFEDISSLSVRDVESGNQIGSFSLNHSDETLRFTADLEKNQIIRFTLPLVTLNMDEYREDGNMHTWRIENSLTETPTTIKEDLKLNQINGINVENKATSVECTLQIPETGKLDIDILAYDSNYNGPLPLFDLFNGISSVKIFDTSNDSQIGSFSLNASPQYLKYIVTIEEAKTLSFTLPNIKEESSLNGFVWILYVSFIPDSAINNMIGTWIPDRVLSIHREAQFEETEEIDKTEWGNLEKLRFTLKRDGICKYTSIYGAYIPISGQCEYKCFSTYFEDLAVQLCDREPFFIAIPGIDPESTTFDPCFYYNPETGVFWVELQCFPYAPEDYYYGLSYRVILKKINPDACARHEASCLDPNTCIHCGFNTEDGIVIEEVLHVDENGEPDYSFVSSGEQSHIRRCNLCREETSQPHSITRDYSTWNCWDECEECDWHGVTEIHTAACDAPDVCALCEHTTQEGIEIDQTEHDMQWEYDADECWEVCAKCGETTGHYPHEAYCSDAASEGCRFCHHTYSEGINIELIHDWDETQYFFDDYNHWQQCADCGTQGDAEAHRALSSAPGVCAVCGHTTAEGICIDDIYYDSEDTLIELEYNSGTSFTVDGLNVDAECVLTVPEDAQLNIWIRTNIWIEYYCGLIDPIPVCDTSDGSVVGYLVYDIDECNLAFLAEVQSGQTLTFTLPRVTQNIDASDDVKWVWWMISNWPETELADFDLSVLTGRRLPDTVGRFNVVTEQYDEPDYWDWGNLRKVELTLKENGTCDFIVTDETLELVEGHCGYSAEFVEDSGEFGCDVVYISFVGMGMFTERITDGESEFWTPSAVYFPDFDILHLYLYDTENNYDIGMYSVSPLTPYDTSLMAGRYTPTYIDVYDYDSGAYELDPSDWGAFAEIFVDLTAYGTCEFNLLDGELEPVFGMCRYRTNYIADDPEFGGESVDILMNTGIVVLQPSASGTAHMEPSFNYWPDDGSITLWLYGPHTTYTIRLERDGSVQEFDPGVLAGTWLPESILRYDLTTSDSVELAYEDWGAFDLVELELDGNGSCRFTVTDGELESVEGECAYTAEFVANSGEFGCDAVYISFDGMGVSVLQTYDGYTETREPSAVYFPDWDALHLYLYDHGNFYDMNMFSMGKPAPVTPYDLELLAGTFVPESVQVLGPEDVYDLEPSDWGDFAQISVALGADGMCIFTLLDGDLAPVSGHVPYTTNFVADSPEYGADIVYISMDTGIEVLRTETYDGETYTYTNKPAFDYWVDYDGISLYLYDPVNTYYISLGRAD